MRYLHSDCLLMRTVVQEMQMRCTVYLSLRFSSHGIWACPDNTPTPLVRPNCFGPLVTVLMGVHCISTKAFEHHDRSWCDEYWVYHLPLVVSRSHWSSAQSHPIIVYSFGYMPREFQARNSEILKRNFVRKMSIYFSVYHACKRHVPLKNVLRGLHHVLSNLWDQYLPKFHQVVPVT